MENHVSIMDGSCDGVEALTVDTLSMDSAFITDVVDVDASNVDLNIEIVSQMYTCGLDGLPIQLKSNDVINDAQNSVLISDIENFQQILVNSGEDDSVCDDMQVKQLNLDYLVFDCFKDFEDAFRNFQKDTLTTFCTAHNTKDFAKFCKYFCITFTT